MDHTLVSTKSGHLFVNGNYEKGQLGFKYKLGNQAYFNIKEFNEMNRVKEVHAGRLFSMVLTQ